MQIIPGNNRMNGCDECGILSEGPAIIFNCRGSQAKYCHSCIQIAIDLINENNAKEEEG